MQSSQYIGPSLLSSTNRRKHAAQGADRRQLGPHLDFCLGHTLHHSLGAGYFAR